MRNQPRYALFKNARYAMEGLMEVFATETSFKIETIIALVVWTGLIFVEIPLLAKAALGLSILFVMIAEIANSAIERVVDLVTQEHHPLAKQAKDAGAAMVLLSVVFALVVWGVTVYILVIGH